MSLTDLAAYVPVDVSEEFLRSEAEELGRDFPRLRVEPVAADFTKPFALPEDLATWDGSLTIPEVLRPYMGGQERIRPAA